MEGISSDGDPKLLSAMCYQLNNSDSGEVFVQDTTHVGVKLRNRLLKPNINLPMGSFHVSVSHLISLVENVQKSVHGLCQSDVCPNDRMNFHSFSKITDDRVIEALQKYVNNSEGTVKYLQICKEVTSSYLQLDLLPLERIFQMWHAMYFLRIWRQQIKSSRNFTFQDNYISANAYTCIELNSRSLIDLVKKYRNENKPELFLPALFDSQTCERSFRQFRSLGTTEYTKINFSLYELLHMIGRMEVQNDIAYIKLANESVSFPNKRVGKSTIHTLPSDQEINSTILNAKNIAIRDAQLFEMTEFDDIDNFQIQSKLQINDSAEQFNNDSDEERSQEAEMASNLLSSDEDVELNDTAFTTVTDEDGIKRKIRKSALVWMYRDPSVKPSKDRFRRFRKIRKKNE